MELIKSLEWRYATKKFDTSKKVSSENLEKIKEAVRLSASSYGLQAYKVLIIQDDELRRQLREVSWNQPQITDSSHLFVFCNYTKIESSDIDEFIQLKASSQNLKSEDFSGYGDFIKGAVSGLANDQLNVWSSKQTYIAMANLLSATAELGIDSCPMEGFNNEKYNEILGLKEKGLNASVIATVGYRSIEDQTQFSPKVRKPKELLFEVI